ncbi:MAG TPA: CARDB domain-containing protein, partial [Longimicrobiales bacterium]|nr:CARDB domain-containing protein [Longimicrobiales bacterium]
GRTMGWGTTVNVDAAVGSPVAGGGCRVVVRHFPRNVGEGPSGPFSTEWRNSAMRGSSLTARKSLARGGFRQEVDEVVLYPNAVNALTLVLDPGNQVTETDEANNQYTITVRLSGTCGARGGR